MIDPALPDIAAHLIFPDHPETHLLQGLRAETPDEAGGAPVGRADVPAGRDGTSGVLAVSA